MGYLDYVKCYKLRCTDSKPSQCIIIKDVTFNDAKMLNQVSNAPETEGVKQTEPDRV